MIIIQNKLIPFPGYKYINLFGILFTRTDPSRITPIEQNHEEIHTRQMIEMLWIPFYIWYVIEWIIRGFQYGFGEAYENISFEREAYANESNLGYLEGRPFWAFTEYL